MSETVPPECDYYVHDVYVLNLGQKYLALHRNVSISVMGTELRYETSRSILMCSVLCGIAYSGNGPAPLTKFEWMHVVYIILELLELGFSCLRFLGFAVAAYMKIRVLRQRNGQVLSRQRVCCWRQND